jgi:hypothetical protein
MVLLAQFNAWHNQSNTIACGWLARAAAAAPTSKSLEPSFLVFIAAPAVIFAA